MADLDGVGGGVQRGDLAGIGEPEQRDELVAGEGVATGRGPFEEGGESVHCALPMMPPPSRTSPS